MLLGSASSVEKIVRSKNNFGSAASKDCFGSIEAESDQAADDKDRTEFNAARGVGSRNQHIGADDRAQGVQLDPGR